MRVLNLRMGLESNLRRIKLDAVRALANGFSKAHRKKKGPGKTPAHFLSNLLKDFLLVVARLDPLAMLDTVRAAWRDRNRILQLERDQRLRLQFNLLSAGDRVRSRSGSSSGSG